MDSVLTLVNPSPPIHLEFDRNSVVNAILRKNSQPAYTIRTKQKTRSARTDVVDVGTQEVIASIEIKDIFPDVVTIASVNGGNSVKISKWMKEEQLPDKTSVFPELNHNYALICDTDGSESSRQHTGDTYGSSTSSIA